MNDFETIRIERDERGVARLILARAERRNVLDAQCILEFRQALAKVRADDATRVLVLMAEGDCFSAGADLHWMLQLTRSTHADRLTAATLLAGMLLELDTLPKPVIARVQGSAFGGGVGLLSACDIVIACDTAQFALSEVRLGLAPATIAPYIVARIGSAAARRLMLTGRLVDAAEAMRIGLVQAIAPVDELDGWVGRELADLLKGAPGAHAATKALCRSLGVAGRASLTGLTAEALADRLGSEEARSRIAGFLTGRSRREAP